MKLTPNGLPVGSYQGIGPGELRPTLAQVALRANSTICGGARACDVIAACQYLGVPVVHGRVAADYLPAIGEVLPSMVRERLAWMPR